MAWLGLNGAVLDAEQYRMYTDHSLKMVTARQMLDKGIEEALKEVLEVAAASVDAVYVSVDIDVVDGSESPGTTACVYQGIRAREFLSLMTALGQYDIVKGIDLCEVAPPLDPTGQDDAPGGAGASGGARAPAFRNYRHEDRSADRKRRLLY